MALKVSCFSLRSALLFKRDPCAGFVVSVFGLLAVAASLPKILPTKQTGGRSMAFKDMLSLYGRVGLIVAAFIFVAGIVAGPLVEKVWLSRLTVTENSDIPILPISPPPKPPADPQAGKQG